MTFPTMHAALARALAARGYETPTAVQLAVLDEAVAGRDLLVSAQTGSGKTVAFGLALGATLLGEAERLAPATAPLALIVAPTRELAMQVCRELSWLYEAAGARVITCVGGMDARAEARQLAAGAHIVVGTPGRLRDHLERRRLDLSGLRALVLDEADEMLDLGFREDLEFILDATPPERRTLLFSATVPREIVTLAGRYQRNAARIETGRRNEQHADIAYVAHRVVPCDVENTVVNVLRLHEARAALVFCATREAVNRLSARLVERGFAAVALSGELTQHERTRALQALRDGRARVLVATDVAARGLDLPDLALVIHADLPNDGETLLHRSGRTGRAGRKGLCVLVVPFNRRRKADSVIASARLGVDWRPAPTPDEIRARDQERFIADATFSAPPRDDEAKRVSSLLAARPVEEIALALIRMYEARLPAPEELTVDAGPPPRRETHARTRGGYVERNPKAERSPKSRQRDETRGTGRAVTREPSEGREGAYRDERRGEHRDAASRQSARADRPGDGRHGRDGVKPMTWFRINIGRNRNGDPRWLLPLICRAGGVSKSEIGAIRIDERETRFEVVSELADQFELHVRADKAKEGQIVRLDGHDASELAAVHRAIDAIGATAREPASEERPHRKSAGKKFHKASATAREAPARDRSQADASGSGWTPRARRSKPSGVTGPAGSVRDGMAHSARAGSKYAKKRKHRLAAAEGHG